MTKITRVSRNLLFSLSIILLSACTGSRIVQPLNQSQWQLSASFGGPVLEDSNQNTRIVPLSAVSLAYGLRQNLTAYAGWHTGSYLNDINHVDLGYTQELLQPFAFRPGITYSLQANLFSQQGLENFRFYPQLDINAYWILANKDFTYVGVTNWFETNTVKAHHQRQTKFWFPALQAGYSKNLGKYSATVEAKYILPFDQEQKQFVDFLNFNDRGAIGIYFSVARTFK